MNQCTFLVICERCWNPVMVPDYLREKPNFKLRTCGKCRTPEENQQREQAIAKWKESRKSQCHD